MKFLLTHIFAKDMLLYWVEVLLVFFLFPHPNILALCLLVTSAFCFRFVYTREDKILYLCAAVM